MKNPWILVSFDVIATISCTCLSSIHNLDFEISNWIINHNRNMSTQSSCSRVPEICCSGREQPPTKCEEKSPASRPMKRLNCFCWFSNSQFCFVFHLSSSMKHLIHTSHPPQKKNLIPVKKIVALAPSRFNCSSKFACRKADQGWILLSLKRSKQHSQGAACGGHGSWVAKSQRTPPAASGQVSVSYNLGGSN